MISYISMHLQHIGYRYMTILKKDWLGEEVNIVQFNINNASFTIK